MLRVGAAPYSDEALGTRHLAVGIGGEFQVAASGVVDAGFVGVDKVPVRAAQFVALCLQGTLSEHHADGVLVELFVVGQRILNLPRRVVAFVGGGLRVVAVAVAREVVLLQRGALIAPEREFGTVAEVVFQLVPQLQVERELRHELMAPVLVGVALHHGDGVVLLLVAAYVAGDGIRMTVAIVVEIVGAVTVNHCLTIAGVAVILIAQLSQCDGQRGSEVEGRAERRAPGGVVAHAGAVYTHIREVRAKVELVQEVALLGSVEQVELVVRADGQTVVVRLAVVTAHDTFLVEVA